MQPPRTGLACLLRARPCRNAPETRRAYVASVEAPRVTQLPRTGVAGRQRRNDANSILQECRRLVSHVRARSPITIERGTQTIPIRGAIETLWKVYRDRFQKPLANISQCVPTLPPGDVLYFVTGEVHTSKGFDRHHTPSRPAKSYFIEDSSERRPRCVFDSNSARNETWISRCFDLTRVPNT